MLIIETLPLLRQHIRRARQEGQRIALVPTMGNLHAGHFSLVKLARQHADRVVASVFVNPTQFGPNEDYAQYPRTPEADRAGLAAAGCDAVWMPSVETMYPFGADQAMQMHLPGVSEILEGQRRPGHFDGVCTVVSRLFNQVQPDVAAFGKKDYQQLAVIRQMVAELAFPVTVFGGEIVREADGLAMSSRNQYLSAGERAAAPAIRQALLALRDACVAGVPHEQAEAEAGRRLEAAGFVVDYVLVRRGDLSAPASDGTGPRVVLAAARIGKTRLIDNLEF